MAAMAGRRSGRAVWRWACAVVGLWAAGWTALARAQTPSPLGRITVGADRHFRDDYGRVRILRGTNDVEKNEPYLSSFTDAELVRMAEEWGYNVLRLGWSWEGYERQRGVKDPNYMAETSNMVTRLANVGIYTIIDSHQDLYSRKYCGNGFPEWAVRVSDEAQARAPFPIPVLGRDVVYEPDPVTGWIGWQDCARSYWGTYYFSVVTGSMFDNFYADVDGIRASYVDMWRDIARTFTGRPEVFYDIINEPFPGNLYTDLRLLLNSSYADETLLQPLYNAAHDAIRETDNDTLIFFEILVSNSEILPRKSGLVAPGGPEYQNRGVFEFHWYCVWQPERPDYCNGLLEASFQQRRSDAERMGTARFLGEFGHLYGTTDEMVRNNTYILDRCDEDWLSWTNWAYARLETPEIAASLVRPYPQALAGTPVRTAFDFDTKLYELQYLIDPTIPAPTEVFLPMTIHYTTGVNITVVPADSVVLLRPKPHMLFIEPSATAQPGQLITVTVTAA